MVVNSRSDLTKASPSHFWKVWTSESTIANSVRLWSSLKAASAIADGGQTLFKLRSYDWTNWAQPK